MYKSCLVLFCSVVVFLFTGYQSVDTRIAGGDNFTCDTQKLNFKSCTNDVPGCSQAVAYCLEGAAPDRVKLCTETGGDPACDNSAGDPDCVGGINDDELSESACDTPTPTPIEIGMF